MATIRITPRERIIWVLLVQGLVKKEIAAALKRSEHTINEQLRRLYAKIGAHKESDAVREYFIYFGYCTRRELAEAAAMPKALLVVVFLIITAFQLFEHGDAFRPVRTGRGASRTISRPTGRSSRRNNDYYA